MTARKKRNELITALSSKTERLEEVRECETLLTSSVTQRSFKLKIDELKKAMAEFEALHFKMSSEEEDQDAKDAMKREYNDLFNKAEAQLFPAEIHLETLEVSDRPHVMTEAEDKAILKARVATAKENLDRRGKFISDGVKGLESPTKAQIDVHLDIVAHFRTEAAATLKEAYKPLIDLARSAADVIQYDKESNEYLQKLNVELDGVEKKLTELVPDSAPVATVSLDTSGTGSALSTGGAVGGLVAYKNYTKPQMPKFGGQFRDYPKWKEEFVECILPHFEPRKQIRLLDDHTPKDCDLRTCTTVVEAWTRLDDKYANPHLISTILIDDYIKFVPRGKNDEAKLQDVRSTLERLYQDLVTVGCDNELTTNS